MVIGVMGCDVCVVIMTSGLEGVEKVCGTLLGRGDTGVSSKGDFIDFGVPSPTPHSPSTPTLTSVRMGGLE